MSNNESYKSIRPMTSPNVIVPVSTSDRESIVFFSSSSS